MESVVMADYHATFGNERFIDLRDFFRNSRRKIVTLGGGLSIPQGVWYV
jgi:hypothetical protein